ncbi:MAG: hypothetical protein Wins2KO_06380 [Winogradskyella sp.]
MKTTKINYNPNIDMESVELEKQHWLKKVKRDLDRRVHRDEGYRKFLNLKVLEVDKCCSIENYYVDVKWKKSYCHNEKHLRGLETMRKDFNENGLSLYSTFNGNNLNPFMINQWYKECKNEILKRL